MCTERLATLLDDPVVVAEATNNCNKFEVVRRRVDDQVAVAFAQSMFANMLDFLVSEILELTKTVQRCSRAMGRRSHDSDSEGSDNPWEQKRRMRRAQLPA